MILLCLCSRWDLAQNDISRDLVVVKTKSLISMEINSILMGHTECGMSVVCGNKWCTNRHWQIYTGGGVYTIMVAQRNAASSKLPPISYDKTSPFINVCVLFCAFIYIYIYIYTREHTHAHTYTHTHTHTGIIITPVFPYSLPGNASFALAYIYILLNWVYLCVDACQ